MVMGGLEARSMRARMHGGRKGGDVEGKGGRAREEGRGRKGEGERVKVKIRASMR